MDKHLMASVYEIRGMKDRAMSIYREILRINPNDKSAESALRRIATRKHFTSANIDMLNFFKKARSKAELYELERWLGGD